MANRLTLFFTSDTHGYLYPTNFADTTPRAQGLFGMRFPKDGNTLVIDGGDTIQGSPLTYYCHTKSLPMPCATAMNSLEYDYVTLGNHDFNYGYDTLLDHLTTLQAQCLCANVTDHSGRMPLAGYAIHTLENGLRVGLVGIVTSWVNRWEKPENLTELAVDDPFEAASEAVHALRNGVDLLIGIYHGGFEKDVDSGKLLSHTDENIACKLCEALPIDILLTGHQHIAMANKNWNGVHVVQTPCNATAYIRLTVDEQGNIESELCKPDLKPLLKQWAQTLYSDVTAWLDQPIGKLSRPIWPEGKLEMALHGSPIASFFNAVQLAASGAQLSCTALGNELRGFDSAVTVRDVVASYVYSNTLVVLGITGAVLREALEQCATYFAVSENGSVNIAEHFLKPKAAHYNYDYFAGVEYRFDLRQPEGKRVTSLLRNGMPVQDADRFTMVTNNYRATGAGDFDCYLACERILEIQTEVSELLLNYLAERELVVIPEKQPYEVILPDGTKG